MTINGTTSMYGGSITAGSLNLDTINFENSTGSSTSTITTTSGDISIKTLDHGKATNTATITAAGKLEVTESARLGYSTLTGTKGVFLNEATVVSAGASIVGDTTVTNTLTLWSSGVSEASGSALTIDGNLNAKSIVAGSQTSDADDASQTFSA